MTQRTIWIGKPNQNGDIESLNNALKRWLEQHLKLRGSREFEIEINRMPEEVRTIAEILREAGYATFGVSDNINVSEPLGFAEGFDRFETTNYLGADTVNATAFRWADEIRSRAPYFLYLHYMDPHAPYHRRQPWFENMLEERDDIPPGAAEKAPLSTRTSTIR